MIVGWSMDESMESRLVVDALEMAIQRRRPGAGLMAHSDRGSQYASEHYQRVLTEEGIVCSMSGVGQCWDNAPMESFFGRLKCESCRRARCSRPATRRGPRSSSTWRRSTTASAVIPLWGSYHPKSLNGRTTRNAVNFELHFSWGRSVIKDVAQLKTLRPLSLDSALISMMS